jgi:hypothetical protein
VIWSNLFENFAFKKVTRTDKLKHAYVPNMGQKRVLGAAGIVLSEVQPYKQLSIKVLNDVCREILASYYRSERATAPARSPEPRMGLAFITEWLSEGDILLLGNIGSEIFALKLDGAEIDPESVAEEVAMRANRETIFDRARNAPLYPNTRRTERTEYVRNLYVVSAALLRAGGKCEMPACKVIPFSRDDNSPYLEVHHIIPLSEHGEDQAGKRWLSARVAIANYTMV